MKKSTLHHYKTSKTVLVRTKKVHQKHNTASLSFMFAFKVLPIVIVTVVLGVLLAQRVMTNQRLLRNNSYYHPLGATLPPIPTTPAEVPVAITPLSEAWKKTKVYSDPDLSITFEYPDYYEVKSFEEDTPSRVKEMRMVGLPLKEFQKRNITGKENPSMEEKEQWDHFCENAISVYIEKFMNTNRMPLSRFIPVINSTNLPHGLTVDLKTHMKPIHLTSIPKANSYLFKGLVANQQHIKAVYFEHKQFVYEFSLLNGCDGMSAYSKDAEMIFDNILKSVKFL